MNRKFGCHDHGCGPSNCIEEIIVRDYEIVCLKAIADEYADALVAMPYEFVYPGVSECPICKWRSLKHRSDCIKGIAESRAREKRSKK